MLPSDEPHREDILLKSALFSPDNDVFKKRDLMNGERRPEIELAS